MSEPTDEQIIRAVAEFEGFTQIGIDSWGVVRGTRPVDWWEKHPHEKSTCFGHCPVPDYLNDLNVMHTIEQGLKERGLHRSYVLQLYEHVLFPWQNTDAGFYPDSNIGEIECDFLLIATTARQRALAAYRTITEHLHEQEGS